MRTTVYNEIERGISLLKLCQQLQSEQDGVDRPEFGVIDKSKTLDQFARDINQSITYMASLHRSIPMISKLADMGRVLQSQGKIVVDYGDDYAQAALEYVLAEHCPDDKEKSSFEDDV